MVGSGLLQKHFSKTFVKISAFNTEINANFHFSHYKSIETISCHSNQRSYPIGTKNHNYSLPPPIDAICEIWKESASEEKLFENDDGRMDDRRRMPAYTISSPMSLRLR